MTHILKNRLAVLQCTKSHNKNELLALPVSLPTLYCVLTYCVLTYFVLCPYLLCTYLLCPYLLCPYLLCPYLLCSNQLCATMLYITKQELVSSTARALTYFVLQCCHNNHKAGISYLYCQGPYLLSAMSLPT